ncbi:MAG TPA: hypothetical protein VD994_19605, partial [Prosthecobacter sp.]|nr:hypothetical protein [Prosthecobacter sp.]
MAASGKGANAAAVLQSPLGLAAQPQPHTAVPGAAMPVYSGDRPATSRGRGAKGRTRPATPPGATLGAARPAATVNNGQSAPAPVAASAPPIGSPPS